MKQWGEETFKSCSQCRYDSDPFTPTLEDHVKTHFGCSIAVIVAHILTLSLLVTDLSSCRLYFDQSQENRFFSEGAVDVIYNTLKDNIPCALKPLQVMKYLKLLLGHDHETLPRDPWMKREDWIASSDKGQIILPSLFESMRLTREPCLQILCYQGILLSRDKPFGPPLRLIVSEGKTVGREPDMLTVSTAQIGSLSRFKSLQYEWRTRRKAEIMFVHLSLKASTNYYAKVDPFSILRESTTVLFAPRCTHPLDDMPNDAIQDYVFVHPESFFLVRRPEDNVLAIYAVRGNDALRLMLLGSVHSCDRNEYKVVGKNSCLNCCLKLCREVGGKRLIC